MDALLKDLQTVCSQLLPIVGVVALVFLSIVLYRVAKLVNTANDQVKNLTKTIGLVDTSMEKIQAPLDSAVKISHSVDEIHDASYSAVKSAGTYVTENMEGIKTYVSNKIGTKQ